jgi:hypothetical protein
MGGGTQKAFGWRDKLLDPLGWRFYLLSEVLSFIRSFILYLKFYLLSRVLSFIRNFEGRSAMTSGACESPGLNGSTQGLRRNARRHADSESGLAGPSRLSPAGGDSKRPSSSLFSE